MERHGILVDIPVRIRTSITRERFCRLVDTHYVNVESALNAYLKSFGLYSALLSGGAEPVGGPVSLLR